MAKKKADKKATNARRRARDTEAKAGSIPASAASPFQSEPELIVMAHPEAGLRVGLAALSSATGEDTASLSNLLNVEGFGLEPLFGETEERLVRHAAALAMETGQDTPDLSVFYRVRAPHERFEELAEALQDDPLVEAAYVKPAAEPPVEMLNEMAPNMADAPSATPNFSSRQGYLNPAPEGIDARYAWTISGGHGQGVNIIDIEGAWRFTHEDLRQNQGGVAGGFPINNLLWRNHGTAVIGEFGADRGNLGVTGICPAANTRAISAGPGMGSANALVRAANLLAPGDIILIELHRPGPLHGFQDRHDQRGYIAIEWWEDDFRAIQFAVARGIIVVEAAGNGGENLDDPLYSQRPARFPASWTNPFNRGNRDSGAIVVGAGAPPPGTHGRDHGPDRSRLGFSNYGALIDAQGWGKEVTTCGYGDLQGGVSEDLWYTDEFSGTSSASPIVVGAIGCIQGALRARSRPVLDPPAIRALLRETGSPQQGAPGKPSSQRIGHRPDLRQAFERLKLRKPVSRMRLYRYWNRQITDHFYTTDFGELGRGRDGWEFNGVQGYVYARQEPGTVPLHRYWNAQLGDHLYTTDFEELGQGQNGWQYERVQCYVHSDGVPGTVPLYRYWNARDGDHFYTTNLDELGDGRNGWCLERIQCYVYDRPRPPRAGAGSGDALASAALGLPDDEDSIAEAEELSVDSADWTLPSHSLASPGSFAGKQGPFESESFSTKAGSVGSSATGEDASVHVHRGLGSEGITINVNIYKRE